LAIAAEKNAADPLAAGIFKLYICPMTKYNSFLAIFVVFAVAFVFFLVFYIQAIFGFIIHAQEYTEPNANPLGILGIIFSPQVIISAIIMALSSLAYRVTGIVFVAQNKTVTDGEKALWIVGFILMGFITGIVFLILAKGRKFTD
jgi:hypothetical protein